MRGAGGRQAGGGHRHRVVRGAAAGSGAAAPRLAGLPARLHPAGTRAAAASCPAPPAPGTGRPGGRGVLAPRGLSSIFLPRDLLPSSSPQGHLQPPRGVISALLPMGLLRPPHGGTSSFTRGCLPSLPRRSISIPPMGLSPSFYLWGYPHPPHGSISILPMGLSLSSYPWGYLHLPSPQFLSFLPMGL